MQRLIMGKQKKELIAETNEQKEFQMKQKSEKIQTGIEEGEKRMQE